METIYTRSCFYRREYFILLDRLAVIDMRLCFFFQSLMRLCHFRVLYQFLKVNSASVASFVVTFLNFYNQSKHMFNFNICLVDIFMHYLTDVFKVYIRLCFSRVNYMKHFSFVRVESYEKVSIFVILCLREFCQQVILFSFSLYCLEILMYFSSIWILTLPCLSLVRVKCPSN